MKEIKAATHDEVDLVIQPNEQGNHPPQPQGTEEEKQTPVSSIKVQKFALSEEKTLKKLQIASNRTEKIHAQMKKGGNLVMTFTPGAFIMMETGIRQMATNSSPFIISITDTLDTKNAIVITIAKFKKGATTSKQITFTMNLFHTKCTILVNGPDVGTFVRQFIPQIKKQAARNKDLVDALDAAISIAMKKQTDTEQDGEGVEQVYPSPTAAQQQFTPKRGPQSWALTNQPNNIFPDKDHTPLVSTNIREALTMQATPLGIPCLSIPTSLNMQSQRPTGSLTSQKEIETQAIPLPWKAYEGTPELFAEHPSILPTAQVKAPYQTTTIEVKQHEAIDGTPPTQIEPINPQPIAKLNNTTRTPNTTHQPEIPNEPQQLEITTDPQASGNTIASNQLPEALPESTQIEPQQQLDKQSLPIETKQQQVKEHQPIEAAPLRKDGQVHWQCHTCQKWHDQVRRMIECHWCNRHFCQTLKCSHTTATMLSSLDKIPNSIWTCGESCYDALETAAKRDDNTAQVKELKEDICRLAARLQNSNRMAEEQQQLMTELKKSVEAVEERRIQEGEAYKGKIAEERTQRKMIQEQYLADRARITASQAAEQNAAKIECQKTLSKIIVANEEIQRLKQQISNHRCLPPQTYASVLQPIHIGSESTSQLQSPTSCPEPQVEGIEITIPNDSASQSLTEHSYSENCTRKPQSTAATEAVQQPPTATPQKLADTTPQHPTAAAIQQSVAPNLQQPTIITTQQPTASAPQLNSSDAQTPVNIIEKELHNNGNQQKTTIKIPETAISRLIGKQGVIIKDLEEKGNVQISVKTGGEVELTGSKPNISITIERIQQTVACRQQATCTRPNCPYLHKKLQPVVAQVTNQLPHIQPNPLTQNDQTGIQLEIPPHLLGLVIGKNGAKIKRMEDHLGVNVSIIKDPSGNNPKVIITGTTNTLQQARESITRIVVCNVDRSCTRPNCKFVHSPTPKNMEGHLYHNQRTSQVPQANKTRKSPETSPNNIPINYNKLKLWTTHNPNLNKSPPLQMRLLEATQMTEMTQAHSNPSPLMSLNLQPHSTTYPQQILQPELQQWTKQPQMQRSTPMEPATRTHQTKSNPSQTLNTQAEAQPATQGKQFQQDKIKTIVEQLLQLLQ